MPTYTEHRCPYIGKTGFLCDKPCARAAGCAHHWKRESYKPCLGCDEGWTKSISGYCHSGSCAARQQAACCKRYYRKNTMNDFIDQLLAELSALEGN